MAPPGGGDSETQVPGTLKVPGIYLSRVDRIFMNGPFPAFDFDSWAESYDQDVASNQFPFVGYTSVLNTVVRLAGAQSGMRVLDLGTGTGNLASRFARLGCELWCMDFSAAMLEKARVKLPGAHIIQYDLRGDWPAGLPGRFERIVSAYVFHHFELDEKVRLVQRIVSELLLPGDRLVIADIAFPDRPTQEKTRVQLGEAWEQEFYWIADEAQAAFRQVGLRVDYIQVSACAGVFNWQA